MFNDTIQSADLSEENKGAAEQEDLPRFFKSINHSEKLGWLAVQMRRPLRGGHCRLQALGTFYSGSAAHGIWLYACTETGWEAAVVPMQMELKLSGFLPARRWRMKTLANGETRFQIFWLLHWNQKWDLRLKRSRDVFQGIKKQRHPHVLSRARWLWSKATGQSSDESEQR